MNFTDGTNQITRLNHEFAKSIISYKLSAAVFCIEIKRLASFLKNTDNDIDLEAMGIHISRISQDQEDARAAIADLEKLGVIIPDEFKEKVDALCTGEAINADNCVGVVKRVEHLLKYDIIKPQH